MGQAALIQGRTGLEEAYVFPYLSDLAIEHLPNVRVNALLAQVGALHRLVGNPDHPVTYERLLALANASQTLVVFVQPVGSDGRFVAMGTLTWSETLSGRVARIQHLAVDPGLIGRGIGHYIVEMLEDDARSAGCASIEAQIPFGNERARELYASRGYRHRHSEPYRKQLS